VSADAEIPASAAYRVNLPEFEGPLDLLLHLCKTHEIDIVNISISFITQKYLEYLEMMQSMSVEVAAEYLVMAATLAYLKSRELVPTPEPLETVAEEGEEALDPREELIRRLLEYQKYKDAAEKLSGRPIEGRNVFGRGMPLDPAAEAGLAEHSVWKLIEAWSKVLEKTEPKHTHNVMVDRMSISDRINQLVDKLEAGGGTFRFEAILDTNLPEPELRHQVVVTLLAVLELARLRVIRVLQDQQSGEFFIAQREGAALDDARKIKATSDASAPVEEAADEPAEEAPPAPAVALAGDEPSFASESELEAELAAELDAELAAQAAGEAALPDPFESEPAAEGPAEAADAQVRPEAEPEGQREAAPVASEGVPSPEDPDGAT
jgi:segregation and condensation protein A